MRHKQRIVEAFKSSGVERILVIDDAYDAPTLDEATISDVADFLDVEDGQVICNDCGIEQGTLKIAASAANDGEIDNDALEAVYYALYARFSRTHEERCDPGGRFEAIKGSALADLRPLYALLCACGDAIEVRTSGLEIGLDSYREFKPQVLFLDYYLSDDVPAEGTISKYRTSRARTASLDLLKRLIKNSDVGGIPAVVLMSSRRIGNIDQYRHSAGEQQLLSLRFQFLKKRSIAQRNGEIDVDRDAVDALLDISQGYEFGKNLQQALVQWKTGAESALSSFMKEVSDLDIKDFAYLLRFRLREERHSLGDYLEWFFGESLKGFVEKNVDWSHASFAELDDDNKKNEETIEGAFDGPSNTIARFFHLIRVNKNGDFADRDYRLGDLYAQTGKRRIWVVITPDCDLVERNGQVRAKSVLTMGGTLDTFDKKTSSADDFLIDGGRYYSILWDPKDLQTFPICGEDSLREMENVVSLGTLRPQYAQEVQRRVLGDLSRVGLPVAPAFGMNVPVVVWIQSGTNDDNFVPLEMTAPAFATIIFPRIGKKSGSRILLRRNFLNELIDRLIEIKPDEICKRHRANFCDALKEDGIGKLYDRYLRTGIQIGKPIFGTGFVVGDQPDPAKSAPWLQIVVDLSEEEMEEFHIFDPLADFDS